MDSVRDPDEEIFDVSGAEVSIQMSEWGDIAQRPVRLMEPGGGLLPAPQHLLSQGGNPSQT